MIEAVPVGAVVTFTEQASAEVADAKWTDSTITPNPLVVGEDESAVMKVTNVIETTVVPVEKPEKPKPVDLAESGSGGAAPFIGIAVFLAVVRYDGDRFGAALRESEHD